MSAFAVADYVVFTISVLISLSIGVVFAYRSRKQQSTEQYLLANRKLSAIPVALSVAVSFESAITMLGLPAEGYRFGIVYLWSLAALPFSFLIGTKILAGLIHPLKITSLYELRFESRFIRGFATVLGILRTIFYMATVMFGPATAIEAVTPFPYWCSIILAGVIAVIYTTIGGMQAVVWTDVFQMVVMSAGMLAILVKSAMISGGLGNVLAIASEHGRLNITKYTIGCYMALYGLFVAGTVGIYHCANDYENYIGSTRHFVLKAVCFLLSLVSIFICLIASTFPAIHIAKLYGYQHCEVIDTDCQCFESRDQTSRVYTYQSLGNCDIVFCTVKILLLAESILCVLGSSVSFWYVILLWRSKYGGIYSGIRLSTSSNGHVQSV